MVKTPPPELKVISENPLIVKRIKKRRVPNTWKYIKTERGPDKTQWAGDTFSLSARAEAAQQPWPENFKEALRPKQTILGVRHSSKLDKFVYKYLVKDPELHIRIFMRGNSVYFLREILGKAHREVSISLMYERDRAMRVYERNAVCYEPSITIPNN